MTSKYFAVLVLFTLCDAMAMQHTVTHIKDLSTEISFEGKKDEMFKLLRDRNVTTDNRLRHFGLMYYYKIDDKAQTCVRVGDVKDIKDLNAFYEGRTYYAEGFSDLVYHSKTGKTIVNNSQYPITPLGCIIATEQKKYPNLPKEELAEWHIKNGRRLFNVVAADNLIALSKGKPSETTTTFES